MSTYNVRLSFKGEGELIATLPIIGQFSIWEGRDIYLRGAAMEIIETLRQYRSMQLEHTIGGELRGCYRVIDVGAIDKIPKTPFRPVAAPRVEHIKDLKAQMMKANELTHFDEEVLEDTTDTNSVDTDKDNIEENEEETTEEPKAELSANIEEITVSVGNLRGKKIGELNAKELRKVLRYSKSEVERNAAEEALKIKFPQN